MSADWITDRRETSWRSQASERRGPEGAEPPREDRPEASSAVSEVPSVSFASEKAQACTALGCLRDEILLTVEKNGQTRVLCPSHAKEWSGT